MLRSLEGGVRGNCWFSLIDKVYSEKTLLEAAARVIANKGAAGVDHVGVEAYESNVGDNVRRLSESLRADTYRPQSIRRVNIPKPGSHETRPLGIPTVQDRVVQQAVRFVIEPIFERDFAERSYGFRPNRGCKDALREVDELLKAGFEHVVDADLKSYFDSIPHEALMHLVRRKVSDRRVLQLIESFLTVGIVDGAKEWTPEAGAPQGAVLSPLLSNIYLDPLDHIMAAAGWEMVRYADDFVVLCRSAEEARSALEVVQQWVATAGLTLHPTKTRIVRVREEGFDFLGYHFEAVRDGSIRRWPREKSRKKLKDAIRAKTKRNDGRSMERIVDDLNLTLSGWYEYFKHSYKATFPRLDPWIRHRLRNILRKREKRKGDSLRMSDHQRWPNKYFDGLGLLNLTATRLRELQSRPG
jgi:RNA-directed DNA polymerase